MNIAFLISAHTDARHLQRLVSALPAEAEFFVHVDAKSDMQQFRVLSADPRVHFTAERHNVMWGSFGQVRYQMTLLREALRSSRQFDYFFSISGLDYPLWSNSRIMQHIQQHEGEEFLFATCLTDCPERARLYQEYRFLNTRPWRYGTLKSKFRVALRHAVKALGMRKPLTVKSHCGVYKLYKGGSWWGITRRLAEEALYFYDNDRSFTRYFVNAFGPDETFIHTVAMNGARAEYCTLIPPSDSMTLATLSPLTYIEYGSEIKIFTENDFDRLVSSGKMFCRKTVSGTSDALISMIDRHRTQEEHTL